MGNSILQELAARLWPLFEVLLVIYAHHFQSVPLSLAAIVGAAVALHLYAVEYHSKLDEIVWLRTEMLGKRNATAVQRFMFGLYLFARPNEFQYIVMLRVTGWLGGGLGIVALLASA